MLTLTQSPFLKALGWTLLNSLWQFGILWLVFVIFLHTRKKLAPALKHGLALVLMSAGFIWFAAGLSFQYLAYSESPVPADPAYNFTGNNFYPVIYNGIKKFLEDNLSWFSLFYLVIVTGFFTRFFRFFYHSHTLQTRGLSKMKPELRLYVQKLVQQLNITRRVQIWISEYIDTPMVMGFIKPVILIPVACINQLSTKQLEAILLHELAHIKRNDYLVNLFTATIEILFFFNPFARLLVTAIKEEREKSCDDWVLQFRYDPYQYASALVSLEQSRSATYTLAIAAAGETKNLLLERIQRIIGINKSRPETGFKLIAYFLTIGFLGFVALVNPGNLVVENFDNKIIKSKTFSPQFTRVSELLPANNLISSSPIQPGKKSLHKVKTTVPTAEKIIENENDEAIFGTLPVSIDINDWQESPEVVLLQSIATGNNNFSIKEKTPELPEAATEAEFPFVPNSSYSYYNTEDSNVIKLKVEKFTDQSVKKSIAQTQKAIEKLDWNKIAKTQKLSKSAILKLQKALQQSFHNLNWSQIYKETLDSINKESTEKMRSSLKQEYEKMNNYKDLQQQYETIKAELIQQQEKYKKEAEKELKEIDKQVKKLKVIVYI